MKRGHVDPDHAPFRGDLSSAGKDLLGQPPYQIWSLWHHR